MKKIRRFELTGFYLLSLVLFSCKSQGKNSDARSKIGKLGFIFQDVQPENYGGAWKRVWNLTGGDTDDIAVDEMNNKNGDNWKEVARTNREGIYVQLDTTKETRLRFDGILETSWMPILLDTVVTSAHMQETEIKGYRCIVPKDSSLVLGGRSVSFNCNEVIIEGDLLGFVPGTQNGRSSGSVQIKADIVKISGKIQLNGERGSPGQNGEDASGGPRDEQPSECTDGTAGSQGGSGGNLLVIAKTKLLIANEDNLKVNGGAGGGGGRAGRSSRRRCSDGASGVRGFDGSIQKIVPISNI